MIDRCLHRQLRPNVKVIDLAQGLHRTQGNPPMMSKREVMASTNLSRSELDKKIASGDFPKPTLYSGRKAVAYWIAKDVNNWKRQ